MQRPPLLQASVFISVCIFLLEPQCHGFSVPGLSSKSDLEFTVADSAVAQCQPLCPGHQYMRPEAHTTSPFPTHQDIPAHPLNSAPLYPPSYQPPPCSSTSPSSPVLSPESSIQGATWSPFSGSTPLTGFLFPRIYPWGLPSSLSNCWHLMVPSRVSYHHRRGVPLLPQGSLKCYLVVSDKTKV